MTPRAWLHERLVGGRRFERLATLLAALLPRDASVLDVGCGDGRLARRIGELRSDLRLEGVDVWQRPDAVVPVTVYDGEHLPFEPDAFDAVLAVDVLHHVDDPMSLLRELCRVARRCVVIKDHHLEGIGAGVTLRAMDHFGNPAQVDQPYNYWPRARWQRAFRDLGLRVASLREDLGLFPPPARWVFERSLHFVACLEVPTAGEGEADALPDGARCPDAAPGPR